MDRRYWIGLGCVLLVTSALAAILAPGSGRSHNPRPQSTTSQNAPDLEAAEIARIRNSFPAYGYVRGVHIPIRNAAEPGATVLGWARLGGNLFVKPRRVVTPNCESGWVETFPSGWICTGQGVDIASVARSTELGPNLQHPLPYRYLFVKEPQTPEYFQLPSREDQRAAVAHGERYVALLTGERPERAALLRNGQLPGEPTSPPVVSRYLEYGFFVASNGVEVRSQRRFVRTIRGTYVKEAQLEERTGSAFQGVELTGGVSLPVAWLVRAARPITLSSSESGNVLAEDMTAEVIPRLTRMTWVRNESIGSELYQILRSESGAEIRVRDWYVALANQRPAPHGVAEDEPWVHVDISSQTLVLYRGPTPVYATLVSTGMVGHDTPIGEFTIRQKLVTDTMSDIGPDAGSDRYRIEDVPWTQYFQGSIALHGAFWHGQFGLRRSHGCVNISPTDARRVFEHTWPVVPRGWHGVSTERTEFRGSRVVVTP